MRESLGARLKALADRIGRIQPLNHDPEAYFVERDLIRRELEREASELDRGETPLNPRGRFETGTIAAKGRMVRVERRVRRLSKETSVWPSAKPSPNSPTPSSPTASATSRPSTSG